MTDDATNEMADDVTTDAVDDHQHVSSNVQADATPADSVAESLNNALSAMREEADRIAALDTSDDQVTAAERFAEGAGQLDDEIGTAARGDDERG